MMKGQCGQVLVVTADGTTTTSGLDQFNLPDDTATFLSIITLMVPVLTGRRAKVSLPSFKRGVTHNTVSVICHNSMYLGYANLSGAAIGETL